MDDLKKGEVVMRDCSRRTFLGAVVVGSAGLLAGCASTPAKEEGVKAPASPDANSKSDSSSAADSAANVDAENSLPTLPPADPDMENQFQVDKNINIETVDDWLGRPDVAYRDMRMIHDPADYAAIGGDSDLSITVEGFHITPFPYIGTLQELPVEGAYDGPRLFDIEWDGANVAVATPRFQESMRIIEEVFPKDKAIFIMCGGAGYAFMMRQLLVYLGWDPSKLYNLGGAWDYTGYHPVIIVEHEGSQTDYMLWRADIVDFGLEYLHPVA